jgi:hypothetical protein
MAASGEHVGTSRPPRSGWRQDAARANGLTTIEDMTTEDMTTEDTTIEGRTIEGRTIEGRTIEGMATIETVTLRW